MEESGLTDRSSGPVNDEAAEPAEGSSPKAAEPQGPSQNGDSAVPAETDVAGEESSRWKRNRRKGKGGKHRKGYKPYSKMTWDERKTLEERETKRAFKKREKRFASGQAMAPYNTTQFLMDQHDSMDSAQFDEMTRFSGEGSFDSTDEESGDQADAFLHKDFDEAYDNYHAERLHAMTKGELIAEHLLLEQKIEQMEKDLRSKNNNDDSSMKAEIQRLTEENTWLRRENGTLKGIKKGESTEC